MTLRPWWSVTLIGLLSTLALTACVGGTRGTKAKSPPLPDAALLVPCPDSLPKAKSGQLPDLMANHKESAQTYHACKAKDDALIESVKRPSKAPQRWWQFWKNYW